MKPFATVPTQSSILQVTAEDATTGKYGNSLPAIYFEAGSTKLRICNDMNGTTLACYFGTSALPMNTFTNIVVAQTLQKADTYLFTIYINGLQVHATTNVDARNWKSVTIRTHPLWNPANVYMKNLIYKKSLEGEDEEIFLYSIFL